MKTHALSVRDNLILMHPTRSLHLATYLVILCLCMNYSSKVYSQKNEFGFYHNYVKGNNITQFNNFGLKYIRHLNSKINLGISLDKQLNNNSYNLESKSLTNYIYFHYTDLINISTVDLFGSYNLKIIKKNLSCNAIFGLSNQIFNVTHIPILEIIDNQINNSLEDKTRSYFIMPKIGINFNYRILKKIRLGVDLFYREIIFRENRVIYTSNQIQYESKNIVMTGFNSSKINSQFGLNLNFLVQF